MPGGVVFEFKCPHGHLTERRYSPGTSYDKHPEILCPVCLKNDKADTAYLIFAYPEAVEKKKSVSGS